MKFLLLTFFIFSSINNIFSQNFEFTYRNCCCKELKHYFNRNINKQEADSLQLIPVYFMTYEKDSLNEPFSLETKQLVKHLKCLSKKKLRKIFKVDCKGLVFKNGKFQYAINYFGEKDKNFLSLNWDKLLPSNFKYIFQVIELYNSPYFFVDQQNKIFVLDRNFVGNRQISYKFIPIEKYHALWNTDFINVKGKIIENWKRKN